MDANELYHFLFETFAGVGILVGIGVVVAIIYSFLMEIRTRMVFKHHAKKEGVFTLFDDDDEQDESDGKDS